MPVEGLKYLKIGCSSINIDIIGHLHFQILQHRFAIFSFLKNLRIVVHQITAMPMEGLQFLKIVYSTVNIPRDVFFFYFWIVVRRRKQYAKKKLEDAAFDVR